PIWQTLHSHHQEISTHHMRDLFAADTERFNRFSVEAADLLLDYSKNILNKQSVDLLIKLAEIVKLPYQIEQLFNGAEVNNTEQRAALHTALRSPQYKPLQLGQTNIIDEIHKVLARMAAIVQAIHTQQ